MQISFKLKSEVLGLVVYLLYLLIFTMRPFEFSVSSGVQYELLESFYRLDIVDFTLNILLFIPFGFLLFSLMKNTAWKDCIKIFICVVLGAGLSFIIETYQMFLPRDSELSDIFMNAVGAFLGAVLARRYYDKLAWIIRYNWDRMQQSQSLLALIVILYSAAFFSLSVFPIKHVDFRNWDSSFTLQLGNEATLDRPWVGKVYLVAIYNRDLSDEEVYTNFKAGPYSNSTTRIKDGLVAFYNFKEGSGKTVHDSSGFGLPLNLTVYNPSRVRWLTPNGLEISGYTIIRSQDSAKKLYHAIKPNNKLTVEVWISPSSVDQRGPARIVSFSKDTGLGNFTLGQEGKNIHFRVRTPLSGPTGSYMNLRTKDGFLKPEPQHVVATYRDGIETVFVDGVEHSSLALSDNIKLLGFFGNNMLSKIAFCFFFFFPLGFLLYFLFLNYFGESIKSSVFTVFLISGLLFVIEVIYLALFPKSFDFNLLFIVVLIGIFTVFFVRPLNLKISKSYLKLTATK